MAPAMTTCPSCGAPKASADLPCMACGEGRADRDAIVRRAGADPEEMLADARLLADYGPPEDRLFASAFYAWRVFRRRRELSAALKVRQREAALAVNELDDALVALTESVREAIDAQPAYAGVVGRLRDAEKVLHDRRRALAVQNDADSVRLASADARIAKLQEERDQAALVERTTAAELVASQQALEREQSLLERAETELRANGQPIEPRDGA